MTVKDLADYLNFLSERIEGHISTVHYSARKRRLTVTVVNVETQYHGDYNLTVKTRFEYVFKNVF